MRKNSPEGIIKTTCLIVIVKVNPSAQPINGRSPFRREPHDNLPALRVVILDTKFHHRILSRDTKLLINLMFDGQAVGIPAKSSLDMIPFHGPVSRDDIFNSGGQEMAIMRKTTVVS